MTKNKSHIHDSEPPLFAIYGPGRSGTTWLGSIINSHPGTAYRFEPFREKIAIPRMRSFWNTIQTKQLSEQQLKHRLYSSLLPTHALIDKPPFFHKNNSHLIGHKLAWNCARKFPLMNVAYEQLYTPQERPPLIFKEVRWNIVKPLLDRLHLRSVFVLRGPHGTISSRLRGQRAGLMPTWQCDNLEQVIEKNNPSLKNELPKPVGSLSDAQKNAVIWRLEAERMFDYLQQHPEHMVLLYEDLCIRPLEIAQKVFEHFNIPWNQQTEDFITQPTFNKQSLKNREKGINSYFSVARNTTEMIKRWSKELTTIENKEIHEIIYPSSVYQVFLQQGLWE